MDKKIIITTHALFRAKERLKIREEFDLIIESKIKDLYKISRFEFEKGIYQYFAFMYNSEKFYFLVKKEKEKNIIITIRKIRPEKMISLLS